jgi:heterodisulfide reductase subunit B2
MHWELGLAQGMTPQELALDLHAVDCKPFLEKIL